MADGIGSRGEQTERRQQILNQEAIGLIAQLQGELGPRRTELLERRRQRQLEFAQGVRPTFSASTTHIRTGDWRVPPAPRDLADRRVEITGPTDAKMTINALNSGAKVFMADFEDANSPTWANMVDGQANLADAVRRTLEYQSPEGKSYQLSTSPATLMVRPRGWHLSERYVLAQGKPVSASFFDFSLFAANNAAELLERGSGPYFYLPKLEGAEEAALWRSAFEIAEHKLGLPTGSVRATVLIETIPAAFEMDEILYALGPHATALNAGRWDYMFSMIKKFRSDPEFVLPDRAQLTMNVPFMRAYSELLVQTCHRRGAHAIGGMAAFIPSRRDPEINSRAMAAVRNDKEHESSNGFDGTWVAHPDLVPLAGEVFDKALGDAPNQLPKVEDGIAIDEARLLDVNVPGGSVTEAGLRNNVAVTLRYVESWLRGTGAVAIFNLMEDAATAEIARSQIWQWTHHGVTLADGRLVTPELVQLVEAEELEALLAEDRGEGHAKDAAAIFERVALSEEFVDFLTLVAYEELE